MGPGILPEITAGKHNPPCHLQMPTKLYHAKRKPYVNMVQKRRRVLWAKARLKWKGDLPVCYQHSVQNPAFLMIWGCISAYGMGSLHVLEGTMNAERYTKVLEQHMLPSRWRLHFREWLVYFSRTMQNHILQLLQQHGYIVEESGCWIGLPAVQIFHL